jgi:hypothetical protein
MDEQLILIQDHQDQRILLLVLNDYQTVLWILENIYNYFFKDPSKNQFNFDVLKKKFLSLDQYLYYLLEHRTKERK